ncbi:zinc finger CCCH domain-containing protein 62-like, partial [Trifolium medium]|nr:zinc finger CCCH domain-containing protein 62-like [Trifolium medium]
IEVLWSKGEKPLPPLHPLLIKGRNLYRLKTLRQKWEDEGQRQKLLMEKHSRGSVARADRESRIQEKEMRKSMKENRISKKDSTKNQSQSHSSIARPQIQPQETTNVLIIPPSAIVNKPAAATEQCVRSIDSRAVTMGSDQFRNSGKSSFNSNHYYADYNYRHKPTTVERYHPSIVETNNFAERTSYPRRPLSSANHFVPRFANASHMHTVIPNRENYQQKQFCRHF